MTSLTMPEYSAHADASRLPASAAAFSAANRLAMRSTPVWPSLPKSSAS